MKAIGIALPQVDAVSKATGEAKYCNDILVEGALYGAILRSPYAHARIVRVDTTRAKSLPGVAAVLTAADAPGKKYGRIIQDESLLAADKVRFIGDEVAAVAAVDQETAEKALDLIEVVYEELPSYLKPSEALRHGAQAIHDAFPNNVAQEFVIERGDTGAGFAQSACVLEETFHLPRVNVCYLEPTTCVAWVDENDKLTIWAPVAAPFQVRGDITYLFDIDPSKVRIKVPTLGGNFGARQHPKNPFLAALLALRTKGPVRLEATRAEEFIHARPRVPATIRLKMGFSRDGAILAKETDIIADNGACTCVAPFLLETMAQRIDSLYRITNVQTKATLVYTNLAPTGAFRGFGNPQMHFALESMMDMAAERLHLDPVAMRLKNATQKGDLTVHGWEISSCGLSECIETVRRETSWDSKRTLWGKELSTGPGEKKRRGIGMACMIHVAGRRLARGFWGSNAMVKASAEGKVKVISGETDVGQGSKTAFAQIAAEEIGLPLDMVRVAPVDTDESPFAWGSFSDRVTVLGGSAVRLAAADLKQRLVSLAAKYFSLDESLVVYDRGMFYAKDSEGRLSGKGIGMPDLLRHSGQQEVVGTASYAPENVVFRDEKRYGNNNAAYTFAAQVAEVEVDMNTGRVELLNLTSAHDLGRVINLHGAQGQVEGALAQGLGYALMEEMVFSDGWIANPSFLEYKLPTACDTLLPKVFFVESNEPHGPFGAKGVAEPGLVPTAPAISNAIYHAAGIRITSLPITPARVLAALEKKRKEGKES